MILHIPHSGTDTMGRDIEQRDINYLTDWFTDDLFNHPYAEKLVNPISRFVCDVERFTDDKEEMVKQGQGICYTKGCFDNDIKVIYKEQIITSVYEKWHSDLNIQVNKTLALFPMAFIVDCHSFPSDIAPTIDFCIGTTAQTPKEVVDKINHLLTSKGFNVGVDNPYGGSMIPSNYIDSDDVKTIMIEVNKKLYLTNDNQKSSNYDNIKSTLREVLDIISDYENL